MSWRQLSKSDQMSGLEATSATRSSLTFLVEKETENKVELEGRGGKGRGGQG